jgi:hypothetical protein
MNSMSNRVLTDSERNAIETVIAYKADQLRLAPLVIERSLIRHLGIQSLRELMPFEFVGVVRHLLGLTEDLDDE